MKSRLKKAWIVLLGRDEETPEDRAFRHERERILRSLTPAAIGGLITSLAIMLMVSATPFQMGKTFLLSILAEIAIFWLFNTAIKWHQKKYGGD